MTLLLACIGMMVSPTSLQQPTVSLTQDATSIKVQWTAPASHINHWVAVVLSSKPDSDINIVSTWWKYLPDGMESGEFTFPIPASGEYEARYFAGNSGPIAARSAKLMVVGSVVPVPDQPLPPVPQTRRVIQVIITRADGTVETRPAEENTNHANPAESALALVVPELRAGDRVEVKEWVEIVTIPTRPPDRVWSVRVTNVIP